MKKKNILITGCSGFLAFNFIKENYKIYNFYCIFNKTKIPKKFYKISFVFKNNNINSLVKFIKKIKPDLTIHMATKYIKIDQIKSTKATVDANILFGSCLLQSLNYCGYKKIINFSSIWQNIENKNSYSPQNFYSSTKEAFEKILEYHVKKQNFKALTLKIYDTYGHNDTRKKVFQFVTKKIRNNEKIYLENKSRKISLVHYKDINSGIKVAINYILKKKFNYKIFSLRASKIHKLKKIIDTFMHINNLDYKINWVKNKNQIKLNQSFKNLPGWKPKISLKQGLQEFKI
jgi:nucleoside-diphosphate-sugar epimerase